MKRVTALGLESLYSHRPTNSKEFASISSIIHATVPQVFSTSILDFILSH